MKILFISPNPIFGGAATANMSIAKLLKDNGYDVIYNDEYFLQEHYENLTIDHTYLHLYKRDKKYFWDFIRRVHPDVIIWTQIIAIFYYFELSKLKELNIKQICIVHSLSLTQNLFGKLSDILTSLCLRKMDSVICVSEYTRLSWVGKILLKNLSNIFYVIPNIISKSPMHCPSNQKLCIGFVGRFSEEKQPELFCKLSGIDLEHRYIAFGCGPMLNPLKQKYKKVCFRGQCNIVDDIYSNIDILVMTSKFENCPMVILEAESRGIPCVAPNVGGIGEIVHNGVDGILYEQYNEIDILQAIIEVERDYQMFSKNAYQNSKRFLPDNIINLWNKVIM